MTHPDSFDLLLTERTCDGIIEPDSLSYSHYSFIGEMYDDFSGYSVSSAGDVDGDGLDDIIIGATGNDDGGGFIWAAESGAGKTYLILGSSLMENSSIDLSNADYAFIGENKLDSSGSILSGAGDVDGDDLDDIIIGVPSNSNNGAFSGKVYLILGSSLGESSTIDLSNADYSFSSDKAFEWFGTSVSSAGDVDGDGLDDIIIGAYGNNDGGDYAGKTYLILGSSLGEESTIDCPIQCRLLLYWRK